MKAATVTGFGTSAKIVVSEKKRPKPAKHDVLVEVYCSSVNPKDWKLNKAITSLLPDVGIRPFIIGDDLSGIVVETGSEVTAFEVGDEVYGMDMRLRTSACAEYAKIAETRIAKKPKNISHVEAGVTPLAALTALQGFKVANLSKGQRILIIGASGGVGTYAVQIAKAWGADVTAVCSYRNVDLVSSLGADHIIDYTQGDFTHKKDSFDAIFDATSYESARTCASLLKEGGVFVTTFGQSKGLYSAIISKFVPVKHKTQSVTVESYTDHLNELTELFEKGKLKTILDREVAFEDIDEAYQRSKSGRAKGKIAIKIAEGI
ncbi:MAG: NAD(P)-dependent alcohol dehydrogenase [Halioglobus sp.]|nr:NAD(P)-dependent alcohol dehydrogenase [Halioglobus sp.]